MPGLTRRADTSAYVALAAVCFFWGTTYLAIRIADETLPPAFIVSARYLLSGSILLVFARWRRAHIPRGRELWVACGSGALVLGIGNASAVYAEQVLPSGITGLLTTLSPFWMSGFESAMGGEPLHPPTILGMLVGLAGTALLVLPGSGIAHVSRLMLAGIGILQVGVIAWTLGSIIQRRQPIRAHPIVIGGVQQLAAGLLYLPIALFVPDRPVILSQRSVLAVLYLVTFGSIVGYSAYIFALDRLPVAIASSYTYVNAVVAMFVGWLFFREPFGLREAAAMLIIFAGVAIVKKQQPKKRSSGTAPATRSSAAAE